MFQFIVNNWISGLRIKHDAMKHMWYWCQFPECLFFVCSLATHLSNSLRCLCSVSLQRESYIWIWCVKNTQKTANRNKTSPSPLAPHKKKQIPQPLSVSPSWFTFDKRGHCDNILKSGHICTFLPLRQKGSQGLTPEPITLQYGNYFNTKWGGRGEVGWGKEKI